MKTHLKISEEILNNTFKCKKGFFCLSGEWKDLCKAMYYNHKTFDLLKCIDENDCIYKTPFGNSYVCTCPTRKEIHNRFCI